MKIIIKYSNRKLYDKDLSRYITLQNVLDYYKSGIKFKVIDLNGNDLTINTVCSINCLAVKQYYKQQQETTNAIN